MFDEFVFCVFTHKKMTLELENYENFSLVFAYLRLNLYIVGETPKIKLEFVIFQCQFFVCVYIQSFTRKFYIIDLLRFEERYFYRKGDAESKI